MTVSGADKDQVGQVAANLRALRPPDPYKQKGIRITGERLKKKAGKAGAKTIGVKQKRRTRVAAPVRKLSREAHRRRIHVRMRKKLAGTPERPRLCVHRSSKHIRAQVVDDQTGRTIVSASSLDAEVKAIIKGGGNIAASKVVGKIDCGARAGQKESKKWCSIAAAISITAACRRLPMRPVRRA